MELNFNSGIEMACDIMCDLSFLNNKAKAEPFKVQMEIEPVDRLLQAITMKSQLFL